MTSRNDAATQHTSSASHSRRSTRSARATLRAAVCALACVLALALTSSATAINVTSSEQDVGAVEPGRVITLTLVATNDTATTIEIVPQVAAPPGIEILQVPGGVRINAGERRVIAVLARARSTAAAGAFEVPVRLIHGDSIVAELVYTGIVRERRTLTWTQSEAPAALVTSGGYTVRGVIENTGNVTRELRIDTITSDGASVSVDPNQITLPPGTAQDVTINVTANGRTAGVTQHRLRVRIVDTASRDEDITFDVNTSFAQAVAFGPDVTRQLRFVLEASARTSDIRRLSVADLSIAIRGGGLIAEQDGASLFGSLLISGAPSVDGRIIYTDDPWRVEIGRNVGAADGGGLGVIVTYLIGDAEIEGTIGASGRAIGLDRVGVTYRTDIDDVTRANIALSATIGPESATTISGGISSVLFRDAQATAEEAAEQSTAFAGVNVSANASIATGGGATLAAAASTAFGAFSLAADAGTSFSDGETSTSVGGSAGVSFAELTGVPLNASARVARSTVSVPGFGTALESTTYGAAAALGAGPIGIGAAFAQRSDINRIDGIVGQLAETVFRVSVAGGASTSLLGLRTRNETVSDGSLATALTASYQWTAQAGAAELGSDVSLTRTREVDAFGRDEREQRLDGRFELSTDLERGRLEAVLRLSDTRLVRGLDRLTGTLGIDVPSADGDSSVRPAIGIDRSPDATEYSGSLDWRGNLDQRTSATLRASAAIGGTLGARLTLSNTLSVRFADGERLTTNIGLDRITGQLRVSAGVGYAVPFGYEIGRFPGYGSVAGRVLDEFNRPVAGLVLAIGQVIVVTDSEGFFGFENVPEGEYDLIVRPDQTQGFAFDPPLPIVVTVQDDRATSVTVRRLPAGGLRGSVQLAEPTPTPGFIFGSGDSARDAQVTTGLPVTLVRDGVNVQRTVSGVGGIVRFDGLAPGLYEIVVDDSNVNAALYRVEPTRQSVSVQIGVDTPFSVTIVPQPRRIELQND